MDFAPAFWIFVVELLVDIHKININTADFPRQAVTVPIY
jgi:hypothetical protein